jgi:hypothetical protein
VVELAERHRLQPGDARGHIPVGDQQYALGRRVQPMSLAQELDPGHAGQPLLRQQQRDLLVGPAEPSERL